MFLFYLAFLNCRLIAGIYTWYLILVLRSHFVFDNRKLAIIIID